MNGVEVLAKQTADFGDTLHRPGRVARLNWGSGK